MAEGKGCDLCYRNAAFQLAVCYSFGFAAPGDDATAKQWLDLSGRPSTDLEEVLRRMKDQNGKAAIITDLSEKGYSNDLPDRYSQDGILADAL
jgi:hypothetical protein